MSSPIRAFVAHSFAEKDKALVQTFLDYFDTLSRSGLDFSWDHAQEAEPTELAKKVLTLIEGKNAFIAICTRHEKVVAEDSLSSVAFRSDYLKARANSFAWKASDWIIQEIGLARGRDLKCILLIESEVRKPGGLQGDVEYIPFERLSPERSFSKINQMIGALSPRTDVRDTSAPSTTPEAQTEEEPAGEERNQWRIPQPDWNRRKYEIALMMALSDEDTDGFNKINEIYLSTDEGKKEDNRASWEAYREWVRLALGSDGDFTKLKTLAADFPQNSGVLEQLGMGYEQYNDKEKAAAAYVAAAAVAPTTDERLRLLRMTAVSYGQAEM